VDYGQGSVTAALKEVLKEAGMVRRMSGLTHMNKKGSFVLGQTPMMSAW